MNPTLLYDLARDRQTELLRESAERRLASSARSCCPRTLGVVSPRSGLPRHTGRR
jgi:hypothetical protein